MTESISKLIHTEYDHRVPAPPEMIRELPVDLRRDGMTELAAKVLLSRVRSGNWKCR